MQNIAHIEDLYINVYRKERAIDGHKDYYSVEETYETYIECLDELKAFVRESREDWMGNDYVTKHLPDGPQKNNWRYMYTIISSADGSCERKDLVAVAAGIIDQEEGGLHYLDGFDENKADERRWASSW